MDLVPYKIILAYKGTGFAGFQKQARERTVQEELEKALRKIGWRDESVLAAGRTDAGVHASGQVVSFQLRWKHTSEDLQNALNYYLPQDMAVRAVDGVDVKFHPRFDAKQRRYSYRIINVAVRDPLREEFAWRVWPTINVDRMNNAAAILVGRHNFKAYGSPITENGSTVREVFRANWIGIDDICEFEICANAFLYHMARRIVFALVMVGLGNLENGQIADSLENGKLELTGLAPAPGLTLEEVIY